MVVCDVVILGIDEESWGRRGARLRYVRGAGVVKSRAESVCGVEAWTCGDR